MPIRRPSPPSPAVFSYGPPAYLAAAVISWFSPGAGLVALALVAMLYLAPVVLGDPIGLAPEQD